MKSGEAVDDAMTAIERASTRASTPGNALSLYRFNVLTFSLPATP
jgi:hypothetical protein